MLLKNTDEIKPDQEITLQLAWAPFKTDTPPALENSLVQVFAGTVFDVREAKVPVFFGAPRVFGFVRAINGLTTTAPHRNLNGVEFRLFVEDRVSRVPGAFLLRVEKILLGRVEAQGLFSSDTKFFVGAALAAVIIVAVAVIVWKVA